jgi:hypothetical protein
MVSTHKLLKVLSDICVLGKALYAPIRIKCEVRGSVALGNVAAIKGLKGRDKGIKEFYHLP